MKKWLRSAILAFPILAVSSADCTYLDNPDRFLYTPVQHWLEISGWTDRVARRELNLGCGRQSDRAAKKSR